jgi:hypothetical protein
MSLVKDNEMADNGGWSKENIKEYKRGSGSKFLCQSFRMKCRFGLRDSNSRHYQWERRCFSFASNLRTEAVGFKARIVRIYNYDEQLLCSQLQAQHKRK